MVNPIVQFLTKSWLFPAILVLFALIVIANQMDFSLTDHVADRVIEKLDANYSPFGPSGTTPGS